jgi:hypothetical protein
MKKIVISFAAIVISLMLSGCGMFLLSALGNTTTTKQPQTYITTAKPTTTAPKQQKKLGLGDSVETSAFRVKVIGASIKQSDKGLTKREGLAVDVEITNIAKESKSIMFLYHNLFGPDGIQADDSTDMYFDDDIGITTELRPGATLSGYFIYPYKGDGQYVLEIYEFMEDKNEFFFTFKK